MLKATVYIALIKNMTMKHVIGNIIQKVTSFMAWKENMTERNYFIS